MQLQGGGDTWLNRIRGRFRSGAASRLQAQLSLLESFGARLPQDEEAPAALAAKGPEPQQPHE